MKTSLYQSLKLEIVELVYLSRDAIHIHVGLAVFFISILLMSRKKITIKCLFPVLFVAISMELLDLYDDQRYLGYFRFNNSLHDLINTLIWPMIIWFLFQTKFVRKKDL